MLPLAVSLMFTLLLPLTDPLISPPRYFTSILFFVFFSTTHSHSLPFLLHDPVVQFCLATRCGRIWFDFRGCVTGTVNHFYCSLTLTSSLSIRETLFQQMGKTHITINLFIEKERFLMLHTAYVLLSSVCISVRVV